MYTDTVVLIQYNIYSTLKVYGKPLDVTYIN